MEFIAFHYQVSTICLIQSNNIHKIINYLIVKIMHLKQ